METDADYFYSVRQQYSGENSPHDLSLIVHRIGSDSVKVELSNRRYLEQRWKLVRRLLLLLCLYCVYYATITPHLLGDHHLVFLQGNKVIDLLFVFWTLYNIHSLFGLIKKEKLLLCRDFALQLQTERFWFSKSHMFICKSNITDIVINEIIEDLDIHYVLIIRTAGKPFLDKPIIPIFNSLQPSIECLEQIYKSLKTVLDRNANQSS